MVFSPGITMDARSVEQGPTATLPHGDKILSSDEFMRRCVTGNRMCTPAALARRDLYLQLGGFPLDLPYTGDWFCWGYFGMHGPVGYIADPLANYRIHEQSMTSQYREERLKLIVGQDITVRWRFLRLLQSSGRHALARACLREIATDYAFRLFVAEKRGDPFGISPEEFRTSLNTHSVDQDERRTVECLVHEALGDWRLGDRDYTGARGCYLSAVKLNRWKSRARVKWLLCQLGRPGTKIRSLWAGAHGTSLEGREWSPGPGR